MEHLKDGDGNRVAWLFVEQAALGELDAETADRVSAVPGFEDAVQELKRENEQMNASPEASGYVERIRRRIAESSGAPGVQVRARAPSRTPIPGFTRAFNVPRFGLAAAAVFVLALVPLLFVNRGFRYTDGVVIAADGSQTDGDTVRVKGLAPSISVHRERPGAETGYEQLRDGSPARPNDTLQISYNAAGFRYGTIFSIDGRGVLTLHHPENFSRPPVLERSGSVSLPYAYRLDDAPMFERFIFVASSQQFSLNELLAIVEPQISHRKWVQEGILELPSTFTIDQIMLRK